MSTHRPPPLVLASSSPYRRQLLERLHLPFTCHAPDIDESPLPGERIPDLCGRLAAAKAAALAARYPNHLLLGCDQSAVVGNHPLGKPGGFERAFQQLGKLSGQVVTFYTAVALLNTAAGTRASTMDETEVHFRDLSGDEISRYLDLEQPFDCAGSFKVEGLGISLFRKVVSKDPTALVGLPMIGLCTLLRDMGYTIP